MCVCGVVLLCLCASSLCFTVSEAPRPDIHDSTFRRRSHLRRKRAGIDPRDEDLVDPRTIPDKPRLGIGGVGQRRLVADLEIRCSQCPALAVARERRLLR